MSKRQVALAVIATLGIALGPSAVSAEGGNGASFCSESGRPFRVPGGPVLDDFSTFSNPGEAISYYSRNVTKIDRPGQIVKVVCEPSR